MSLLKAKQRLEALDKYLEKQVEDAKNTALKKQFETASAKLAIAIGKVERELYLAWAEGCALPLEIASSSAPSDDVLNREITTLTNKIQKQVNEARPVQECYDNQFILNKLTEEASAAASKQEYIAFRQQQEIQYCNSFKQLYLLKKQSEPLLGVEDELNSLLMQIKRFKKNGSVPVEDLTKVMNAAYDRLTGGSKEKFETITNEINEKDSTFMKILGATLVVLGLALTISVIFFAPAVITSAAIGLPTIYAATLGAALTTNAFTFSGAACFFTKTPKMQLAATMAPLEHDQLTSDHYEPVGLKI